MPSPPYSKDVNLLHETLESRNYNLEEKSNPAYLYDGRDKDNHPIVMIPQPSATGLTDGHHNMLQESLTALSYHARQRNISLSVVIDARNQKWRNVTSTLRIVNETLLGLVYVVYIIQPAYLKSRCMLWILKSKLPLTTTFLSCNQLHQIGCPTLYETLSDFTNCKSRHQLFNLRHYFTKLRHVQKEESRISLIA